MSRLCTYLSLWLLAALLHSCGRPAPQLSAPPAAFPRRPAAKAAKLAVGPKMDYEDQRKFDKLFLEAVRQKQMEHIDAEYELLEAALAIERDAPEALYELGVIKLSCTAYSDTLARAEGDSLLRRAAALDPGNLFYKETLAIYLANTARFRDAIRLYEEIADTQTDTETLVTLVWLYKTSGDYPGAIRTLERLERLEGRSEALSMEKFQTYLAMKDNEHAYQAIEDLCAEYPLDLRYRVLLGDLYDQNGYHERALDIYRDVLTADPENSYAQLSLLAYYKAARADSLYLDLLHRVVLNPRTQSGARIEAMRAYAVDNLKAGAPAEPVMGLFRQALDEPQENREMAELCAYYMVERGMPADSVMKMLYRILDIEPDYTKARLQILQILVQRGDMGRVAEVCHEGELYDPSEVTFYYYEGEAQYCAGKNESAIHTLQRGAERIDEQTDPLIASDVYALLGDVLHDSRLNEEAYLAYERSLEFNPMNLFCLNNYAYFLAVDGTELEKAERMSRLTVEAPGADATFFDTYAWVLYRMKEYEKARIYIDEALRTLPFTAKNASVIDHAGDIYFHCNDRAKALEFWRRALEVSADRELTRQLRRKLRRRRP